MERVLIVEDNKIFAKIIDRRISSKLNFSVDVAPTFHDVEDLIGQQKKEYFIAIIDLNLPDAKNERIVDYVLSYKIPSIIFTSEFDDEVREKMLGKNIVDYVIKETVQDIDYVVRTIDRIYKNQFIKVMVVDDSDILRKLIKRLLRIHRYQVLEACNGREALDVLEKHPDIKLIITDFQMPVMDGFELVTKVRQRYNHEELAIIGISAHGSGLLSAKFLKKGANDFVNKPFVNEEFHCRISQNIEMIEHMQAIREASIKDYLTGLYNRRHFYNLSDTLFKNAIRGNLSITVAMIDIDHFKKVNDSFGHKTGDYALKHISQILSENLRQADVVSRYGGEEFCVLCSNMDKEKARLTFERIRKIIEDQPLVIQDEKIPITVSIGINTQFYPSLEGIINRADELLYQAKQSGRNCIAID